MDPEAKRFVNHPAAKSRTIILTPIPWKSAALCHRVGIMVSGQFSCIGSLQHLKTASVKAIPSRLTFIHPKNLKSSISRWKNQSHLLRISQLELKLRVDIRRRRHQVVASLDKLQRMKTTGLIVDYSISQTTLEQVFVIRVEARSGTIALSLSPLSLSVVVVLL